MASFKEQTGLSISVALESLFGKALPAVPELTPAQLGKANQRMSASSGGAPVHRVTEEEARKRFLKNAKGSWEFSVNVCVDDAYKGEEAAQMWASYGGGAYRVHIWKSGGYLHVLTHPAMWKHAPD